jgi:hypothetical protein
MSDDENTLLETGQVPRSESGDIAVTFNLFKTYLDSSLNAFKTDILEGQEVREIELQTKLTAWKSLKRNKCCHAKNVDSKLQIIQ